jgi:hypothetical protein
MGTTSNQRRVPSNFPTAEIRSRKISPDRRRKLFRVVAKHAYPRQTAFELRKLTRDRYGERTIYDWIAGRSDAPLSVFIQVLGDILAE